MSKYKVFVVVVILLAITFPILYLFKLINSTQLLVIVSCLAFLYILFTSVGAYFIQLNFFVNSFNKGNSSGRSITLTFDDGPHTNTLQVLDVLKKYDVKATFFIIGKNIEGRESILQQIITEGHSIGNHSYEHSYWYSIKKIPDLIIDINKNNALLENITNKKTIWFRPPYGVTNPRIAGAIEQTNMQSIGWSIRSYDTVSKEIEPTFNRIIQQITTAEILLLHDHLDTTAQLLDKLIGYCINNNIAIISLENLLDNKK